MHSSLLALMMLLALGWRWGWRSREDAWSSRWQSAWLAFCLPPLMILSASMAVLLMGHHGTMMGWSVSPLGCWISLGVVGLAISTTLYSLLKVLQIRINLSQYPTVLLPSGEHARLLKTDIPVAAQVGFWRSVLLVSHGWLDHLSAAEQQAILHHEQAHIHYRDPLWFFGLGIVRRLTLWLPQTEVIWQELLLLREIRADRWAAQHTEPLLVAELLVKLTYQITTSSQTQPMHSIGFHSVTGLERVEQRVEALLQESDIPRTERPSLLPLAGLFLTAVPLVAILLHS
jgi:Zn-dependent protease with chaperone function